MHTCRWRTLLVRRYGDFFAVDGSSAAAVFPFACGDGWAVLLWRMCRGLRQAQRDFSVQPRITDIKEKWGTLRVSDASVSPTEASRRAIDHIIATAEAASEVTCEVCGNPGHLDRTGWWRTLCPVCAVLDGRDTGPGL